MVLSAHFAVLACLCAALPLALPPVEAAHLYGGRSMEKHATSHSSRHRTHDTSSGGRPTATHRHDGKTDVHLAPSHRAPGLPPLLRRYRVDDRKKVHNHQGQDPHDHTHHKVARSAFARSRYRRATVHPSRRSSVYVNGEHGNTYLVSRTLPKIWGHGRTGTYKQSSHPYNRRQVDESSLVLGRIDIMDAAQSPSSSQRLASLTVDSTPIDWASGQSSAKAFSLNASTNNQTQFIMMPIDDQSNAGSSNKHVTIATEVFDASSAEMVMYCATYDADPGATSALLMTPCTTQSTALADDAADPCVDDASNASSSNAHESQIFSYDPSSGQIEPISTVTSSSGNGNNADDLTPCAGVRVRRDNGHSTTSGSAKPSSTSTNTAPTTSASQQAQNVTLIYVAGALEVPAPSPSSSRTTSVGIGSTAVFTTSITTTVVAAATTSGSSNRTATPAQAAESVSTSSTASQSTTVATPSVFATAARSSLSASSSVSATATRGAPANANESFEVEIVRVALTTTASFSSTSATTATPTTMTTASHSSVTATLDAYAVASSIANSVVHSQRAAIVSASVV